MIADPYAPGTCVGACPLAARCDDCGNGNDVTGEPYEDLSDGQLAFLDGEWLRTDEVLWAVAS